ncbi:uncharacterized protein SPSK_07946 [Sporothrix schenckii 1099-18]|uniref:Uncharacterized protein n=1 Tax=Sporothrix schenckii 1099-18 TaxID=1397361 RepID=A0A0F2MIG3_SPOSC|nr:uncharacterized protein SPSK_07946 [Sporothrix schenckii 1099-18]KJR87951.1 hypothetical protein SPSK_07946 [Sporothrix schenckii 1099-18]
MVLLHQVNPEEPKVTIENQEAQRHHAHQVCGIVAHTKDRGVASVAIRSLAISAHVLRDPREQDEVYMLLKKITAETGWRIGRIYTELQQAWGRGMNDIPGYRPQATVSAGASSSPSTLLPPPMDLPQPATMLPHSFGQPGLGPGQTGGLDSSISSQPVLGIILRWRPEVSASVADGECFDAVQCASSPFAQCSVNSGIVNTLPTSHKCTHAVPTAPYDESSHSRRFQPS